MFVSTEPIAAITAGETMFSLAINSRLRRWRASSADIYRYLVKVLVEDAPGTKKEQQKEETGAVDEKEK